MPPASLGFGPILAPPILTISYSAHSPLSAILPSRSGTIRMIRPALLYTLFVVVATLLGCYLCVLDDRAGQLSLGFLDPGMKALSDIGNFFVGGAAQNIPRVLPFMLIGLLAVGLRRRSIDNNLIFCALTVALGSEYFLLIAKDPGIGAVGYVLAFAMVVFAIYKSNPLDRILDDVQTRDRFSWFDAMLLGAVTFVALIFRIHALNWNVDSFEGELAPYSAAATSIPGSVLANRGYGPWAPLGLLYYVPIWFTTTLFDTTLLALRLSSSIVGVITIPAIYFLARRIAGREAALLAAMFVALNNQHIGWGRTDVHPHGVTTWPAALLCIVFLRAVEKKRIFDWLLVVLCMGLTWHQYPSGQSSVAIPIFASAIYFFVNGFKLPFRLSSLTWLALGAMLWFIGLPLSYWYASGEFSIDNPFNLTGPRAVWGGLEQNSGTFDRMLIVIETAISHFGKVIEAIFFRARHIFHQDFLAEVPDMAPRSYPWLLAPFMFVSFIMLVRTAYRIEVAVLLGWIIAAIAPGIFSEQAYPKRLSTLFPALDIVGAIGIVIALHYIRRGGSKIRDLLAGLAIALGLFYYTAFEARQWFNGQKPRYGEPPEVQAVKDLSTHIPPGSVVIADLSGGYYMGKITYLILDYLTNPQNRPNLWFIPAGDNLRAYVENPKMALKFQDSWAYQCTKLREQIDETAAVSDWKRVVFVVQDKPANEDPNSAAKIEMVKQRCNNPRVHYIPGKGSFWVPLVVVSCDLGDLK